MDKEKNPARSREVLSDCLMIVGAAAVSVGVGMLSLPAGIFVAGVMSMAFGWLVGRGGDSK